LRVSGYTPVFDSVFQGTLCGKYPDLPVWLVLLALQQRGGIIDAHPSYIATVSGIPQADIELAIKHFCEPDPASRTPENDGRRLVPLEGKGFGWRVVNHDRYREKARKQAYDEKRTASGADAERKKASRSVPMSPAKSRALPLSEAEAEAYKNPPSEGGARKRASKRAPAGWLPPVDEVAKLRAECPGVDIEAATRKFLDHTFRDARSDWLATWRNWIRGEKSRNGTRPTRFEENQARLKASLDVAESAPTNPLLEGIRL
jgi:hypothetical protein